MARHLGLRVVAEGVETVDQLVLLQEKGCSHYQGYLFSRPLPCNEFEHLLQTHAAGTAAVGLPAPRETALGG
jgi:EAL domain-containing protein (putative c-di-GMP-specific phosphodiesterase class I)